MSRTGLAALLVVAAAAAAAAAAGRPPSSEFVRVPSGRLVHRDCVYRLSEPGAFLEHRGDDLVITRGEGGALVQRVPRCPYSAPAGGAAAPAPLHGPAWKAWTLYDSAPAKLSSLVSNFVVPGPPQNYQGEISYFWNGIEPEQETAVLQPVLQYGNTPAGGGEFWGVASWYVSSSHGTVVTPLIKVAPGDTIVASNTLRQNGSWTITGTSTQQGQSASFTYKPASDDYTRAYHVLEEYDIQTCQCYPAAGQVTFFNVSVEAAGQPVTPQWQCLTKNNQCGEHATVTSPTEVVIHTKPPADLLAQA